MSRANQLISLLATLAAVGIKTILVSMGGLPTKSKSALAIDLFVIPSDVKSNFIIFYHYLYHDFPPEEDPPRAENTSLLTQFKYSLLPATIGVAMISGT